MEIVDDDSLEKRRITRFTVVGALALAVLAALAALPPDVYPRSSVHLRVWASVLATLAAPLVAWLTLCCTWIRRVQSDSSIRTQCRRTSRWRVRSCERRNRTTRVTSSLLLASGVLSGGVAAWGMSGALAAPPRQLPTTFRASSVGDNIETAVESVCVDVRLRAARQRAKAVGWGSGVCGARCGCLKRPPRALPR